MKAQKICLCPECLYNYRIRISSSTRSAEKNPEQFYSKIDSLYKILDIAKGYPNSEFEKRVKKVLFSSLIQYLIIYFEFVGYNSETVQAVLTELNKIALHLDSQRLSGKIKLKWMVLKFNARVFYVTVSFYKIAIKWKTDLKYHIRKKD